MTGHPYIGRPVLVGEDGEPLLSWEEGRPLEVYGFPYRGIPGALDPSSHPLGGPVSERVYTLTATLHPAGVIAGDPPAAVAAYPVAGRPFGASGEGVQSVEIRLASRTLITASSDTVAPDTAFPGRVIDPGSISLSMPLVPVGEAAVETTVGRAVIDNADGRYDTAFDRVGAIGQPVRIRGGRMGRDLGGFVPILDARITAVGVTEDGLTLDLAAPTYYAQNLFPVSVYTGNGGIGGDPDLDGVARPVILGRVWNMSPVCINGINLIHQVHDGAVAAITGVFDGGVPLTFTANYPTYASLAGASLSGGQYATCLALGLIRVQTPPVFGLTAHVDGHAAAGITVRSIASWLLGQIAGQIGLTVDTGTLATLPEWTAGWLWTDAFTWAEAISRFVGDGGCSWGSDSDGAVRITRLEPPDPGAVAGAWGESVESVDREPMGGDFGGIHQRRIVRFQRNWTVQSGTSLAATAEGRARRQQEWRSAVATAAAARNAVDPPVLDTSLFFMAHAQLLAAHLIALHGVQRQMFSVANHVAGAIPKLGSTWVQRHPRFGLVDGVPLRVVALDLSLGENTLTALLWG